MKKILTIAMAAALTLAAAGQASAAALETGGEYRGRYWFLSNYTAGGVANPNADSSQDFFDQRLRLKMAWQVSETVKVNARADVLENTWDFTTGTSDKSEIDFDWANVAIGLGGANKLELGKMDVSWGPGMYAKADNRYRARFSTKVNNIGIGLAYDMVTETTNADNLGDNTALTLGAAMPVGAHTFGVLGIYNVNKSRISGATGTAMADTGTFTLMGIDGYWLGTLGPVKMTAEVAYATGEYDNIVTKDRDHSGLMAYVGANMPVGPVGIGLEFGYASGDDPTTTNENEGVLAHDYNGPFNSFILFNNFDLNGYNSVYSGGVDKGLGNAMAFKASGTFAATKQLSVMGAVVWAVADQTIANQADDLGVEVDLLVKYAMTENVTLQTGIGYLAAGDYYKTVGVELEDPYVVTAHAIVTF